MPLLLLILITVAIVIFIIVVTSYTIVSADITQKSLAVPLVLLLTLLSLHVSE